MFIVGEAVIDETVGSARFCCNLAVCRGACCCIEGGRGAPLDDQEAQEIRNAYPVVRRYLREISIKTAEAAGLVEGSPGDYATPCIGQHECAYVCFEDGIARCSFERAFLAGEIGWQKPLSCHLFPVRVRRFGQEFVRYEEIEECSGGRARGTAEGVMLHEFLKEPLTRKFGAYWYAAFVEQCKANGRT
jgi:hypothetical protein